MNTKKFFVIGLSLASAITASAFSSAQADQIDEERLLLDSRINEAASNNQISNKDAKIIRQEMANFRKKRDSMLAASGDRFTAADDLELDHALNRVSQDFDKMKAKAKMKAKQINTTLQRAH